jgi:hypothetical protein
MFNRDKFEQPISLVTNEKAPNAVFVDHLNGFVARPELFDELLDYSKMGKSQSFYFKRQFERNVLNEKGAALLVIDPYSEMNFQLWRHRYEKWRCWVPKAAIRDTERFQGLFESCGYQTFEESICNTAIVVRHIVANNPGMATLFLPQILDYYPALSHRENFNDLGASLKDRISDLYVGARVPYADIIPEDLGTGGGPEYTLHFSAKTYWAAAGAANLGDMLQQVARRHGDIVKNSGNRLPFDAEEYRISLRRNHDGAFATCDALTEALKNSIQQYIIVSDPSFVRTKEVKYRTAIIDLERYRDYSEYQSVVKKFSKGSRIRMRNYAKEAGYYCKPFAWKMHTPDIYDINTSTDVRSGGKMRTQKTVEEMGGAPTKMIAPIMPKCFEHWSYPWGVFEKIEGHKQGQVVTNERLVGYIFLKRYGELVLYSLIMGHYDYLEKNVMNLLHHEVVKWLLDSDDGLVKGIKAIMYGGYDQGGEGLINWKRREAFEPFVLVADD